MDGSKLFIVSLTFGALFLLYFISTKNNLDPTESHPKNISPTSETTSLSKNLFPNWHECANSKLNEIEDAKVFWDKFEKITKKCDSEAEVDKLPIVTLKNRDEDKFALLPVKGAPKSENVMVTLGVGTDIDAENALKEKMREIGENITFYGADPITDINADLYSSIGKFFPFAVGNNTGFSEASVLVKGAYVYKNVVNVNFVYFLKEMLKIKVFDHIWFDAEGAEYGLFDIFYKNGRLDENEISFCQMSLEVHNPNAQQKEAFMVFIKQLLKDQRFAFFHNLNVGHMRMWLMNFESTYCKQKFLP